MAKTEFELIKTQIAFQLGVEKSAEFKSLADLYGTDAVRKAVQEELGESPEKRRGSAKFKSLADIVEDDPEKRRERTDFFERVRESAVLIQGGKSAKEARVLTIAALKPEIGQDKARFARLRSTQRQRAARAGASQTIGTTPQGLFDPAHLARRQLTDNPFFRSGGRA